MGELWAPRVGQTHLEMTGDPMTEMTKDAGCDQIADVITVTRLP